MNKKILVSLMSLALFASLGVSVASATTIEPATKLKITTAPQTIDINASSSVITVEAQNTAGSPAGVSSTTYVNLNSSSITGVFSSKSATECGLDWNKTQITIASGDAHKSFCYKDSTPGSHTLTIAAASSTLTGDSQIITVKAPTTTALESISIISPATKLSYTIGETLDIRGLVIMGTYSDSSTSTETIAVTDISGFNSSALAPAQVLTITVKGKTTTYTVEIKASSTSTGSTGGGYIPGWGPNGRIVVGKLAATSSAQVLGTSTEKVIKKAVIVKHKLTAKERKLRALKRRANNLAIKIYDLKHPQKVQVLGVKTATTTTDTITVPVNTDKVSTSSASSTPAKKPFWRLW